MAENSKIQWTMHTFNPWRGCTKVSAGCANCYADTLSKRNPKTLGVWGAGGTRVVASEAMWREPVKWDREAKAAGERRRVFCASLADVFEAWHGPMSGSGGHSLYTFDGGHEPWTLAMQDVRNRLFRLIDATPNLDWLVLTKRPENIPAMMPPVAVCQPRYGSCKRPAGHNGPHSQAVEPRSNLWLGTSVENQEQADGRIPHLLKVPAVVRFLSVEPLLGEIDLSTYLNSHSFGIDANFAGTNKIDWVIIGGESGPRSRPCNVSWVRSIVDQCDRFDVACFVKQLGALVVSSGGDDFWDARMVRDPKGGDITEFPDDLRVREFPERSVS